MEKKKKNRTTVIILGVITCVDLICGTKGMFSLKLWLLYGIYKFLV